MTLKAWWTKSTTNPMNGNFHSYMSRVADAHVKGGGIHSQVIIPADLTIALMGWVQMRIMTALNTIAPGPDSEYVFGKTPEPADVAEVGQAWMRMLTLQLGILLNHTWCNHRPRQLSRMSDKTTGQADRGLRSHDEKG